MTDNEIQKNEFDDLGLEDDFPDQAVSDVPPSTGGDMKELTPENFQQTQYLKNPEVGQVLEFEVEKVVENPNTKGTNKTTGESFTIGLKSKDGKIRRVDIHTTTGVYTISAWEVFFKLFGSEGILSKYGKENNTFKGAKISITKNYDGSHANMTLQVLMKLLDKTAEEAEQYKQEVGKAFKDRKLYTIKLLE